VGREENREIWVILRGPDILGCKLSGRTNQTVRKTKWKISAVMGRAGGSQRLTNSVPYGKDRERTGLGTQSAGDGGPRGHAPHTGSESFPGCDILESHKGKIQSQPDSNNSSSGIEPGEIVVRSAKTEILKTAQGLESMKGSRVKKGKKGLHHDGARTGTKRRPDAYPTELRALEKVGAY